ncbi:MAG TPA: hypothetical protein P5305_04090 [Rubrivivax sp.]|nr:hypothetical protein [Rubrivivax sp.]HRY87043.1 hypothetical protein [Rubrivivax sp.]
MQAVLAVVLVVRLALFPSLPPIHVERFETEYDCHKAAWALDHSTELELQLSCEVDT